MIFNRAGAALSGPRPHVCAILCRSAAKVPGREYNETDLAPKGLLRRTGNAVTGHADLPAIVGRWTAKCSNGAAPAPKPAIMDVVERSVDAKKVLWTLSAGQIPIIPPATPAHGTLSALSNSDNTKHPEYKIPRPVERGNEDDK